MRTHRNPSSTTPTRRLADRLRAAHRRWAVREPPTHVRGGVFELSGRQVDVTLDDLGVVRLEQHRPDTAVARSSRTGWDGRRARRPGPG